MLHYLCGKPDRDRTVAAIGSAIVRPHLAHVQVRALNHLHAGKLCEPNLRIEDVAICNLQLGALRS